MADPEPLTPAPPQPPVVTFPAEVDATNAQQLGQRLDTALAIGAPIVVADMTATQFCDSLGLGVLVTAHKRAAAIGAELRVAVTSEDILRVLGITKLDTVLHIYPSAEKALANGMG
jgi:anti-sigma B factor antagonist